MILVADSCAFPSVDHSWIFMVLERAVPLPVKNVLRGIYTDSNTNVEYASAVRRQFVPQLSHWVGIHVPAFRRLQISVHTRYLSVEVGPGPAGHRWTKARNKFVGICVRIRSSSPSLVRRLLSFKIYALSVFTCIGSVAEPDTATITAKNLALQRPSAGPLHALSPASLRRRSTCGLKKLMLTVSSLRARLLVFALRPVPMYSQQAWRAQEPQKSLKAQPLTLARGVGKTCIFTRQLLISRLLPSSLLTE